MKNLFRAVSIVLVAWCLSVPAFSQLVSISNLNPRGFDGVHVIPGKGYYTFYFGEKAANKGMANFNFLLYDLDLKPIKAATLELSKGSELLSSAYNGEFFLLYFGDVIRKTATYVTLDSNGNLIQQKEEKGIKMAFLNKVNAPMLYPSGNEFLVVRSIKEKKTGYLLERLDRNLQQKYYFPLTPNKGIWDVIAAEAQGNKLYLLRKASPNAYSDVFEMQVLAYDMQTGKEQYTYSLNDGSYSGYPSFLRTDASGNVYTGGMYFKGKKFDEKNSDGLFYLMLNSSGQKQAYSRTAWKSVKDKINDNLSSGLIGGKTKILVQDMVRRPDGTFAIITETFRKSNNANFAGSGGVLRAAAGMSNPSVEKSDVGFTIMDFVIFSFDANGNLSSLKKIEKPTTEMIVKGSGASKNGLELAMLIDNFRYFNYQYQIEHNGQPYLVYIGQNHGYKDYAYFMPLDAESTKNLGYIDLYPNLPEGLNTVTRITNNLLGAQREFNPDDEYSMEPYGRWRDIKPAKPGYMLLHKIVIPNTLHIWLEPIPAN